MSSPPRFAPVLRRVARGVARLERDQVCCGDTTLQQFETLRALREVPGQTTGELAERFGIDLSTASRNLAVLERNGYIARERSAQDARRVTAKLTAKGTDCVTSLCCDEDAVFDAALARVPEAQRAALVTALEVLARALEDAPCEPASGCCPSPVTSNQGAGS